MHEGIITTGSGAVVDAADLAGRESWNATWKPSPNLRCRTYSRSLGASRRACEYSRHQRRCRCVLNSAPAADKPFFSATSSV
jgi:hypothetical protein